jgi:diacylglycerol kinase (ATP)
MSRQILYIVNPISGTRNKGALQELIRSSTEAAGLPFDIVSSVASGDYTFLKPLIREKGVTDVVIAGGDGTINQVINGLKEEPVSFGIIPCGSGNGLAFSAKIPKDPLRALRIVFAGKAVTTDAFRINDRFACMLTGLGFDAQVAHDFANDPKRGLMTYIRKTVANFFSAKAFPFTIKAGTAEWNTEAFFISVANSNQFGNNFTIAPRASLTDGLLDIVIMTRQHKLSMLLQAARQVSGFNRVQSVEVINEQSGVVYFQTESLHIDNPRLAPMHIDGDPILSIGHMEISVMKGCFRLLCP